jgi:hypothetical protein
MGQVLPSEAIKYIFREGGTAATADGGIGEGLLIGVHTEILISASEGSPR